jgi:hypothetical protein
MKRALIAAAVVAGIGFATTITATDLRHDASVHDASVVASEVVRSVVTGIILGSGVEPFQSKLVPDLIESRVTASGYALPRAIDPYSVADE